ncbi:hypothetical protein RB653_000828 [Dictyostelium firmibasis]|uniref:Uncharacterized protein n=1 Tax=Dictyostelium firmibasis TaxID=79012 RepID=A0AAN7YQY4_9MYCE
MDFEYQLNVLLKKTKFNLLQYKIENKETDQFISYYKASLNLNIENKPLRGKSGWVVSIEEAKNQCAKMVYDILLTQPSVNINVPPEIKPLINATTILVFSLFLNNCFLIILEPKAFYILFPIFIMVLAFLIIPWELYKNKRILMSTGDRVIVRKSKCYEKFILPIKYIYHKEFLIDLSNGNYEQQDINDFNHLAIAKKNIFLTLVHNQDIGNQDPTYKIVKGCGLRVRKAENGLYSCTIRIVKDKELTYFSSNISEDYFYKTPINIFKVMSKSGISFFPEQYSEHIVMTSLNKYITILSIHFNWLISFFYI